jgi:hypothetical protein
VPDFLFGGESMATYPNAVPALTRVVDGVDDIIAAHQNLKADEIEAIATELGVNPRSIDDTIAAGASPASVAAFLDMVATLLKSITSAAHWYDATAIAAATAAAKGIIELATYAEINTGTDAERAITPDAFAAANPGKRIIQIEVFGPTVAVATGNGKKFFVLPSELNGYNLVGCHARVITPGTTNSTTIAIYNYTDSCEVLSTLMGIESGEYGSDTGAAGVIDTTHDDAASWDLWGIDVDAVSTTAPLGLIVTAIYGLP